MLQKHVRSIIALISALTFASPIYPAAEQDHRNLSLRYALNHGNIEEAQQLLQEGADPNYIQAPHTQTFSERMLKKYWFINKAKHEKQLSLLGIGLIACVTADRCFQDTEYVTTIAQLAQILVCYTAYQWLRLASHNRRYQKHNLYPNDIATSKPLLTLAVLYDDHNDRSTAQKQISAAKILLDAKANVHNTDNHGNTALHYAVLTSNYELQKMLVKAGADTYAENNYNDTPRSLIPKRPLGYDPDRDLCYIDELEPLDVAP